MNDSLIIILLFGGPILAIIGFTLLIFTAIFKAFSKTKMETARVYKICLYMILIGVISGIIGFGLCMSDFKGIN